MSETVKSPGLQRMIKCKIMNEGNVSQCCILKLEEPVLVKVNSIQCMDSFSQFSVS